MKKIRQIALLLLMSVFFMHCGGGKKLSVEEFNQMPVSERVAYLEKRAEKNPNDLALKRQLYQEYLNAGNNARALAVMEQMLEIDPGLIEVQFEYGELQYKSGNIYRAYDAFLKVMQSQSADFYLSRVAPYVAGNYLVQPLIATDAEEGYPCFSPDGKKLLYQRKAGESWDIYEYDLESGTARALIATPADEELPVYSPDGSLIAFTSTAGDRRPIDPKYRTREIATMAVQDGYIRTLTQSFADDWLPRFNRSGSHIVFISERSDLRKVSYVDKQSDIYIMEKDGDFQHQLTKTPGNEGGAVFSADERRIFFHSNRNGNYDIFSMRTDGDQVLTVVDEPAQDVNPAVSPDGQFLAFVSNRSGNYEIYRSKINGENPEQLTVNPAIDDSPVFSPDGTRIAFHSNRSGNYDIYMIDLTSGGSGELTVERVIERLNSLR